MAKIMAEPARHFELRLSDTSGGDAAFCVELL